VIERWYNAEKDDELHLDLPTKVFQYVEELERVQSDLYERFFRLNCLYDPYFRLATYSEPVEMQDRLVSENVVASSIDTVVGIIATAEVRPRVLIDSGDWEDHRRATRLSWYSEGLGKQLNVHPLAVSGFKDAALKGSGLTKVWVDWNAAEIKAQRVPIEDIVVPDGECRGGRSPKQMHHRQFVDKEELKLEHPEFAEEIENSSGGGEVDAAWTSWAGYRPVQQDHTIIIESWHLPYGKKGSKNYSPGRHTISLRDFAIVDEEYHKPYFPFARMAWTERAAGWYAIGGGERIAGHQRRLNKLNRGIDRQQDQLANPTTWVQLPDANIAAKTTNRLGTIAVYKAAIPKTVIPQAVSPEQYGRLRDVKDSAFEEVGVSRLAASAKKPGRLDSGAALREFRDQSTQRFAPQEKNYEQYVLDIHWLAVDGARDMAMREGFSAPVVIKKLARGSKKLEWKDVDTGELRIQMQAAATLSRTPAGRTQMVLEWAQAGILNQDEARKLLSPFDPLDLDKAMSLYTASLDDIDMSIEEALDGDIVIPEPYQNLKLGIWRFQQSYLQEKGHGASDEILENLRQWIVQAAHIVATDAEQQALMAQEPGTPETALAPQATQIAGIG